MRYECPKCGSAVFFLTVQQTAVVAFHEEDDHEIIDQPHGDIEWDGETQARCSHCDHGGLLSSMVAA